MHCALSSFLLSPRLSFLFYKYITQIRIIPYPTPFLNTSAYMTLSRPILFLVMKKKPIQQTAA